MIKILMKTKRNQYGQNKLAKIQNSQPSLKYIVI